MDKEFDDLKWFLNDNQWLFLPITQCGKKCTAQARCDMCRVLLDHIVDQVLSLIPTSTVQRFIEGAPEAEILEILGKHLDQRCEHKDAAPKTLHRGSGRISRLKQTRDPKTDIAFLVFDDLNTMDYKDLNTMD